MKFNNPFHWFGNNLLLAFLLFCGCTRNNHVKPDVNDSAQIARILHEATDFSGFSIALAKQKVDEALKKSELSNQKQLIVESLILSGEILILQGENKEALDVYNRSLVIARGIQYTKGICEVGNAIGDIYYDWGDYDKSLKYYLEADRIAEVNKYYDCRAVTVNRIGKYYHTRGSFEKADELYQKAFDYSRKANVNKETAMILVDIGKNYISLGKLHLAMRSYLDAYKISEKVNNKILDATICDHLGAFYQYIGQNERAIQYYRKAMESSRLMNNPDGISKSSNNIGMIFFIQNQQDSAFYYFQQSFDLCTKTGYNKGIVKALVNLGKIREIQGKTEEGNVLLLKALDLAHKSGYAAGTAEAGLALGNHYKLIQKPDTAILMFTRSIKNIKESNLYDIIRDDYLGLFECYQAKGDLKSALHYHILLSGIEKKLLNVETNKQLAILQISFDSERKEKDNRILKKENELKEMAFKRESAFLWLFIAAFGCAILLCILIYNRFKDKQKANHKLEALNLKILKQNKTLEKLNEELGKANQEKDIVFSIITHELRNPLYWFQNLAEMLSKKYQTMKPEKVQKTLMALDESARNAFHLMDNLLNWSRSKLKRITPRKGEHSLVTLINETIQMYETILNHKEIRLEMNIPENVRIYVDSDLFSCVLRNLLSNAIKYTPARGVIELNCIEEGSYYIIKVTDSGKGISGEHLDKIFNGNEYFSSHGLMQEKGSGLGLKICSEFVALNNGKIWASSDPGKGTCFYFTAPNAIALIDNESNKDKTMVAERI